MKIQCQCNAYKKQLLVSYLRKKKLEQDCVKITKAQPALKKKLGLKPEEKSMFKLLVFFVRLKKNRPNEFIMFKTNCFFLFACDIVVQHRIDT